MKVIKTKLEGCLIFEPKVFEDKRGYFLESFNQKTFKELSNTNTQFVQDNESFSTKGVLRGLHMQRGTSAQAKLVRVLDGRVLDIALDLRKDSISYGQFESIELTGNNRKQFFIPRGFAHGFVVLSDYARFSYKCDNYYDVSSEAGIRYDDPDLGIDWLLKDSELIISDKDSKLPFFKNFVL